MISLEGHARAELNLLRIAKITKAEDPTKFMEVFEKGISRLLFKEYQVRAKKAVDAAMSAYKGNDTEAQVKAMEKALEKAFNGFGEKIQEPVAEMVDIFYRDVAVKFIDEFGLKVQKASRKGPGIEVDFSLQDTEAIAAVERITVQSAGRYFPEQLASHTSDVIRKVVLESGLPIKEAALKLEEEIRGALGLDFGKAIPTQFAANPQSYFEIVASNAAVQASNLGRMIAMEDAGVEKYRIVAILDRRTSTICRALDGKEFAVSNGMEAVKSFNKVQSIEDLENVMGFSKDGSVPKWAGEGKGFPPYHHKCRTLVVPVF